MAADEVGTHTRWSAFYDKVVGPEAERHGGQIKDLRGDGVLIEFTSVLNAVRWARSVHAAATSTGLSGKPGSRPPRGDSHGRGPCHQRRDIRRCGESHRTIAGTCRPGWNCDFGDREVRRCGAVWPNNSWTSACCVSKTMIARSGLSRWGPPT